MSEMHKLLRQQLHKADSEGGLDLEKLLAMVSGAYEDLDNNRRRTERANRLMTDELDEAYARMQSSLDAVALQNMRFEAALNNMQQGLCLFDNDGRLVVCNSKFRELYRIPADFNPVGQSLVEILQVGEVFGFCSAVEQRMLIEEHASLPLGKDSVIEQLWPDGHVINLSRHPVKDGGFLDTMADITESRKATAQIAHMANYDALTDLPNRALFRERLVDAMLHAQRGELSALMCLDLDRFKAVNDTLGHPVGDALLIEVTARLRKLLRTTDTIARLGGDEFVIIQRRMSKRADAQSLAQRIITRLSRPYQISGHHVSIGVSIGIEFIGSEETNADDLIRNADLALYKAKAEGRGMFCVFEPELHASLTKRCQFELELHQALKNEEFEVHYQPQFDILSKEIKGFEALVRWRSPLRGMVSPADFIPLCEEIGLIDALGVWVLRRACRDAAGWPSHLTIAVNLSPAQFKSRRIELVPTVTRVLSETGLAPTRLELEITENVLISDLTDASAMLRELKKLGVRVSLDDFGTGYSSLSYIRHFPFDKIKIDQSFVRDLGTNNESLAIIRAISGMCSSMGIVSIAEGVETQEQYDILRSENCNTLQGYLFGRPLPLLDTNRLIAEYGQRTLRVV